MFLGTGTRICYANDYYHHQRLALKNCRDNLQWPLSSAAAQSSSILEKPSWVSWLNVPVTRLASWMLPGRRRTRTVSYVDSETQWTVGWSIWIQSNNITKQGWPTPWGDCRHGLKAGETGYLSDSDTIVPLDTQYAPLAAHVKGLLSLHVWLQ